MPGCSSNCLVDTGFKCIGKEGDASVCLICGNGIKEGSEECDNPSSPGCSKDCKVNPGYFCRGINSMCYRSDPVCGNNVGEIAESCDDGNLVDGDGCNKYCLIEKGYFCTGELGEPSKCQLKPAPVCGNGIFE